MKLMHRIASVVLLFCSMAAQAVEYVQPKPLADTVKAHIGSVKSGPIDLPIISWGADMATIYANGNSATTSAGSLFAASGQQIRLVREDVFERQLERYISGQTPYLRGTLGMISMASDLLNSDPRTKPIVIFKLSDSAGGDALVVKDNIRTVADLKGKTICLQAYGPHLDYLMRILNDAGLSAADVRIRWVKDLTGTANTPAEALRTKEVDAAFVISPDALALTSNGNVGTGAEDSVRGAHILLSTRTANKVIVDVYAVRADYLQQNRDSVQAFVGTLLKAQENVDALMRSSSTRKAEYQPFIKAAAKLLLDSDTAITDVEGMYSDAQLALFNGNKNFFTNNSELRRFDVIADESLAGVKALGMVSGTKKITAQAWNYELLRAGIASVKDATKERFDENAAAAVVSRKQQQGSLSEGELYSFEVYFGPNQNGFTAENYREAFERVIALAATYGGALITVEGHADPMAFLRQKQAGQSDIVLGQVKQSARNLSLSRAQSVRDAVIGYAKNKSISLDPSQFVLVGHGIAMPRTGICGSEPCAPKNETEWRSNMRVVFRIIQVEAESSVFKPL